MCVYILYKKNKATWNFNPGLPVERLLGRAFETMGSMYGDSVCSAMSMAERGEQDDTHIPSLHLGAFTIIIIRMTTDRLLGYCRISGGLNLFFETSVHKIVHLAIDRGLPICFMLARSGPLS